MCHFIPTIAMKIIFFYFLLIVVKIEQKFLHCALVHEGQRSLRELSSEGQGSTAEASTDKMGTTPELRWNVKGTESGSREEFGDSP